MAWVFAVPVVGFVVFLAVGTVTGRVQMKSCCGIADPSCDARMRDAYLEGSDASEPSQPVDGRTTASRPG